MENKKRSIAWMIICIFLCVTFVPIIIFNSILSIKAAANPNEMPTLFGISPTTVMTGSMAPEINAKDLIFIKDVNPDSLKENDVICFVKDGEFITHRIERLEIVEGEKRFYTKGDANNTEDNGYIVAAQIQGKYVGKIAGLGGVILFLQTPYGLMLTVILLVMLYIAGELFVEWRSKHKENVKLKREIEELKAQLNKDSAPESELAVTDTQALDLPPTPVPLAVETDAPDEVIITENGFNVRYKYKRSFISRLIQGGDKLQDLYATIKNYLLKRNGVKARVSWGAENFSYKRQPIARLCVKGKTLYAYLALTDEEIAALQIDEKVESNKYASVPAKIKVTGVIKSNRTLRAIDAICERLGLTVGEEVNDTYSYPYETDEQLLKKGLIKLVKSDFVPPERKSQETQTEALEPAEKIDGDDNDLNIKYKYKRSFISRLIQSGENTQSLYTTVKNRLLRYSDVKGRSGWSAENFSYKRQPIARLCVKGKTLYAYLALTDEEIAALQIDEKVESNKYASVPAKIKITGIIKINRALKAVDTICQRLSLTLGEEITQTYSYAYETDEQLLKKGLVKLVESNFTPPVQDKIAEEEIEQAEIISDVEDILTGKLAETQKYTRQQYLALPRAKKKKIKALIRQVDEHTFDEDTPSNARKRQAAEMWREAVLTTNK